MNKVSPCKRAHSNILLLAAVFAFCSSVHASTYEPTGINLGGTSFMDGFGRNDPGFTLIELYQYKDINKISDYGGDQKVIFNDPKVESQALTSLLSYTSPYRLLGGNLGFEALLPLVHVKATEKDDSMVPFDSDSGTRFGDVTFGPYLQMDPVIRDGRPVFVQRFALTAIAPTGSYNDKRAATVGSGFWSFNPYWAMTYMPTPKVEMSTRLHYLYNGTNNSPNAPAPGIESFKAGEAVWANFTTSYEIWEHVRVGVNGYYFKQISDDKENGHHVSDSRTTSFAIGPGATWQVDSKNILFVNAYNPVTAKNTISGFSLGLRWIHVF